jgi:hypothetical protein
VKPTLFDPEVEIPLSRCPVIQGLRVALQTNSKQKLQTPTIEKVQHNDLGYIFIQVFDTQCFSVM